MVHVYPLNDICTHELEGTDCPCGPNVDLKKRLVVHHSVDGREFIERNEAFYKEPAMKKKKKKK